jgi:hypothetical protein
VVLLLLAVAGCADVISVIFRNSIIQLEAAETAARRHRLSPAIWFTRRGS